MAVPPAHSDLTLAAGSYWLATSAATGSTASWTNATVATDTNSSFDPSQLSGWSGGVVPDSAGAMATFGASIGANDSTITLDGNRTVGELTFANSAFNTTGNYTIAAGTSVPTSTLTLDNAGAGAAVTNYYGNNVISAPVVLNDNVQLMIRQRKPSFDAFRRSYRHRFAPHRRRFNRHQWQFDVVRRQQYARRDEYLRRHGDIRPR